ncbi:MAG: hypothetical protein KA275_07820, partial [Chitinophagaceae bacterium]|nr:hypothetical protein [Chitinophagaceae bacterium]
MTFLEKITPAFLAKFDRNLLLNNPDFWSTRFIHTLLFTILGFLGISGLFFISNNDVRNYSDEFSWMFLLCFLIFVSLVIWFIFLFRFNVFKRFGKIKKTHFIVQFLCFFFTFFLFFTWLTSINFVESYQANKKYSTVELANDINAFNKNLAIYQQHKMPKSWGRNTYKLVNSATKKQLESGFVSAEYYSTNEGGNEQIVEKENFFKSFLPKIDSIQKINDSTYYEYTCPNYCLLNNTDVFSNCKIDNLKNKEIFFSIINKEFSESEKKASGDLIQKLIKKYHYTNRYTSQYDDVSYINDAAVRNWNEELSVRFKIDALNNSLYNIANKKYKIDVKYFSNVGLIIFVFA